METPEQTNKFYKVYNPINYKLRAKRDRKIAAINAKRKALDDAENAVLEEYHQNEKLAYWTAKRAMGA